MTSERTRRRLVERLEKQGIRHPGVLGAMQEVPRHLFVDEALASRAYEDTALPIGHQQTISQPFVVALMTELVLGEGTPPTRVLEIGTGSGYQTAVLARLVTLVYTVERVDALAQRSKALFQKLKIRNVVCRHGDGNGGWPAHGPFGGILLTAAPKSIPDALLQQLAPGGRLVAPVGNRSAQQLQMVTRSSSGFETTMHQMVHFVPMLSGRN